MFPAGQQHAMVELGRALRAQHHPAVVIVPLGRVQANGHRRVAPQPTADAGLVMREDPGPPRQGCPHYSRRSTCSSDMASVRIASQRVLASLSLRAGVLVSESNQKRAEANAWDVFPGLIRPPAVASVLAGWSQFEDLLHAHAVHAPVVLQREARLVVLRSQTPSRTRTGPGCTRPSHRSVIAPVEDPEARRCRARAGCRWASGGWAATFPAGICSNRRRK